MGGEYSEPTPSPKGSGLAALYNIAADRSREFAKKLTAQIISYNLAKMVRV